MPTALEESDTGRTTAGSVVVTTKRGTNQCHGDEAFYERAASLNAHFPIENPAPNHKQPFSRQNYVGTLSGPLTEDKLWLFASFEYAHDNASIAYSPDNRSRSFQCSHSIQSLSIVSLTRFYWSQSSRSQWFFRGSADSYTTHNALVQQGMLPSTVATTHNNYANFVINNQFTFSPAWVETPCLAKARST